ncbi:MAG: hypothetical protein ACJ76Y_05815 [Thermoanaerobaculia bacterium]
MIQLLLVFSPIMGGPSKVPVDVVTLKPSKVEIPFVPNISTRERSSCGSECGHCVDDNTGHYACIDARMGPIIALFETRKYIGKTAHLLFTTGISPYRNPTRPPEYSTTEYQVHIDGRNSYSSSFRGCTGPSKVTVEFVIASETTKVEWVNVSHQSDLDHNWLIIGTDDCNPNTIEATLEIHK